MSLYSLIKQFVGKLLKNPIKVGIIAYLVWKVLKPHVANKESFAEGIKILKRKGDKELIYDTDMKIWAIVQGNNAIYFSKKEDAEKIFGEGVKMKASEKLNKLKESFKEIDARYQNPDGTFKKMHPVDDPSGKESKFNGCVRYQMAQGKSKESAEKICAYIARMKGK